MPTLGELYLHYCFKYVASGYRTAEVNWCSTAERFRGKCCIGKAGKDNSSKKCSPALWTFNLLSFHSLKELIFPGDFS